MSIPGGPRTTKTGDLLLFFQVLGLRSHKPPVKEFVFRQTHGDGAAEPEESLTVEAQVQVLGVWVGRKHFKASLVSERPG